MKTETKSLLQIKNEVAIEKAYRSWREAIMIATSLGIDSLWAEVDKRAQRQAVERSMQRIEENIDSYEGVSITSECNIEIVTDEL